MPGQSTGGGWVNPFATPPAGQDTGQPPPTTPGGGWKNPFATPAIAQKPEKGQPSPSGQPQAGLANVVDPEMLRAAWDYKTAVTGMFGEPLPNGAEGWTPYGTPYFGSGMAGKAKEYWWMFTRNADTPKEEEWDVLKEKWKSLSARQEKIGPYTPGKNVEEQGKLSKEALGLAVEAVKISWRAGTADESLLSFPLRVLGVGLKGIGDLFNIPAVGAERIQGVASQLKAEAKERGLETLPDFFPDDNWFTRWLNDVNPITTTYASLKLAFSPEAGLDVWKQTIKEGWDAGRIYYSGVYDPAVKEEFLRRYRAGENPELLAMELENPGAELVGQFILDPLNPIGWLTKAKTADRVLDASRMAVTASGTLGDTRAVEIIDELGKLDKADNLRGGALYDEFTKIHMQTTEAVQAQKLTQQHKFTSLAAVSNQSVNIRTSQNFIGIMQTIARQAGRGFDEIAEFVKAGVMSVSKNADEAKMGVSGLIHFDAPKLMFSEDAIKTFSMVRKLMEGEDGALNAGKLLSLTKVSDPQKFMDEATKLITNAAKTSFPTVDELADAYKLKESGGKVSKITSDMAEQFKRLDKYVLAANYMNTKAQKVYSPMNRILGTFYFSLQGGVAVKNWLNNNVQIFIDLGPRAFVREMEVERIVDGQKVVSKRLAFWSQKKIEADLEKMLGFKTPLTSGFETQFGGLGLNTFFNRLMAGGERGAANRIVWSTLKDSLHKLSSEKYLGSIDELVQGGMSEGQARHLLRLIGDNYGDIEKARQEFRQLYGSGSIESWRTLDYISKHYEDGFHELDVYDEIADFAKNGGKSQVEVDQFFDGLKKAISDRGAEAAGDGARITEATPGFESFHELEKAVDSGLLTDNASNEILRTWLVAANEAKHQYMEALHDANDWVNRNLPQQKAVELSNRFKALRNGEQAGLLSSEQKATAHITSARQWSQEVRDLKNPTRDVLADYWTQIGINGQAPADLTRQGLQEALWTHFRDLKGSTWQEYYGTLFSESRDLVTELGKVTDITPLKAKLTQADMAVEKANALRTSIYRKGTFYAPPGKRDVLSLASLYGIQTATKTGTPNDKMVLNIINKYNGYSEEALQAEKAAKQGQFVEATVEAGIKDNPLYILKQKGGVNAEEFSDIMGGKIGIDKEGVIPGLFSKSGMGLDDAGRMLADYGFISAEQAEDLNFVRDYIRNANKRQKSKTFVQYLEDVEGEKDFSPYYDEAGKLVAPKRPNQKFGKLEDVPGDVALEAFERWRSAKGEGPLSKDVIDQIQQKLVPAYPDSSLPSVARAWNENTRPALYALDKLKGEITSRWGQRLETGRLNANIEKAMFQYTSKAALRMGEGKAIALKYAEHWRDFIIHNYGAKTYADLTFAFALPYQFWYSRTYVNWMKRLASDPHIVAGYAKYKNYIAKENASAPEWLRGQLEVNNILGIPLNHPLIFNLEAALNPLNGLTGVDFNDPEKRVNWWTSTLDDMNKVGPTLFAPLQWGVATALSIQGQDDAASRWASRAVPETAALKGILSGVFGENLPKTNIIPGLKYGELDPMVNLFSGGIDPYERSRVGYALGSMIESKEITQEQAIDASHSQSGTLWDEAVRRSTNNRMTSNLVSWGFGVGFKPRTEMDKQISSMFTELRVLGTLNKDNRLTPEQYRQSMDALREKYKFMDTVLLSRRGGEERDTALAYNVLGRLPPGASREALLAVGLTDEDIQKFYDSKGWKADELSKKNISITPREKEKFMNAVMDLAAMLKMPDYATRTEWNDAKAEYKALNKSIEGQLGDDIWQKVSAYYDMRDIDSNKASEFKSAHPEIVQALSMRQEGIFESPVLVDYYGSIDKLESYIDGKVRQQLADKYGDLSGLWREYYDLQLQERKGEAKMFWRSHPELIGYVEDKKRLTAEADQMFISLASKLPEQEAVQLREGFEPETGQQKQLLEALQPEQAPSWQDIKMVAGEDISPALETLLTAYWQESVPLSQPAKKQLDYLASRYGRELGVNDAESFLRLVGIAMSKQQAPAAPVPTTAPGGWVNAFATP